MPKNIKIQDGKLNIISPSGTVDVDINGNLTVSNDLVILGSTTTIDTANLTISDNVIVLNKNEVGAGVTQGTAGIEIERGTSPNVLLRWSETATSWEITNDGTTFSKILTVQDTGVGSGLDADTLDGFDSSAFARKAGEETITGGWVFKQNDIGNSYVDIDGTSTAKVLFRDDGEINYDFGYDSSSGRIHLSKYITGTLAYTLLEADKTTDYILVKNTLASIDDTLVLTASLTSEAGNVKLMPTTGFGANGRLILEHADNVEAGIPADFFVESPSNINIKSNTVTKILDSTESLGALEAASLDKVTSITALDDTPLTITAGQGTGANNGSDLILKGGTSTSGQPGSVIIGDPLAPSSVLSATNDLILESVNGNIVIGQSSAVSQIQAEDEQTLTLSGGDSLAPSVANGGDLILKGGTSALGADGKVIVDGDLQVNGQTTGINATRRINFFVHSSVLAASSANSTIASAGIVENSEIQLTGHTAFAETAPTANTSYTIRRHRQSAASIAVGSVDFTAGQNFATQFIINTTSLNAGDILSIENPATPDATISNITITLNTKTV